MQFHFEPTINLGNLITLVVAIVAFIIAWTKVTSKVADHDKWIEGHMHFADDQVGMLHEVKETTVKLSAIADGQETRIRLLESLTIRKLSDC